MHRELGAHVKSQKREMGLKRIGSEAASVRIPTVQENSVARPSRSPSFRLAPQPRKRLYFELETFKQIHQSTTKWGVIGFKRDTN